MENSVKVLSKKIYAARQQENTFKNASIEKRFTFVWFHVICKWSLN